MLKSSKTNMINRRSKEPFNSALESPVALTPDQLEAVVGSLALRIGAAGDLSGTTTGAIPPVKTSIFKF